MGRRLLTGLDSDLSLPPLSHDQRFFLKTLRSREVQALLAHLPRYVHHLQRHPHSLLARLLGTTCPTCAGLQGTGRWEERGREGEGSESGKVLGSGVLGGA